MDAAETRQLFPFKIKIIIQIQARLISSYLTYKIVLQSYTQFLQIFTHRMQYISLHLILSVSNLKYGMNISWQLTHFHLTFL